MGWKVKQHHQISKIINSGHNNFMDHGNSSHLNSSFSFNRFLESTIFFLPVWLTYLVTSTAFILKLVLSFWRFFFPWQWAYGSKSFPLFSNYINLAKKNEILYLPTSLLNLYPYTVTAAINIIDLTPKLW